VKRLSFGLSGADVTAAEIRSEGTAGQSFVLSLPGAKFPVRLRAFGRHNVYNALAAAAGALALGVEPERIREGLEAFTPFDKRFNLEETNGIVLIDDTYNANPASMEAALVTVRDLKGAGGAVAVLGDMLELGPGAAEAHEQLGRLAAACVDRLFVIGEMAERVEAGAIEGGLPAEAVVRKEDRDQLFSALHRVLRRGDLVLVKGSRGMRMDEIAARLRTTEVP
jgi:UDP-N-acetylmuramoyl-tripeptide--D-alanyl-D-alanine ligase